MIRLLPCAFILSAVAALACGKNDIGGIQPGTVFVSARDSFFQPDTIQVKAGLPVRWTNDGTVGHTVVSDSGLWTSNVMAPAWWFEVRFDSAGTYPYHCSLHAGMTGTVVVNP
jgi:plastocyanin